MLSSIKIGGSILDLSSPRVMAIVNVTPDSFYAPSRHTGSSVLSAAASAIEEGADILDIGGCSTRPGSQFPDIEEEYSRVRGAFLHIRSNYPDFPLSLDTFRAEVVRRVVEEFGAVLVNDVSGGQDPDMFRTVSDLHLPYVLCHMPVALSMMHAPCCYEDIISDILRFFAGKFSELSSMGVYDIVLDPNFGFAKSYGQNFQVVAGYSKLLSLGLPLMAGVSRKRFVCAGAGCMKEDALPVTSVLHMALLERGASLLRVHDVSAAKSTIKLFHEITKA